MTPLLAWSVVVNVLVSFIECTDLSALCNVILNRPTSQRLNIVCDEVVNMLDRLQTQEQDNEIPYEWLSSSVRNSRDTSHAQSALSDQTGDSGLRVRRGGNYIRFGRSVSSSPAVAASQYLHSFGNRDSRSDGHYVRFGRSIPEISLLRDIDRESTDTEDDMKEKRFMRFGKRGSFSPAQYTSGKDIGAEKRFMRFGRDPLKQDSHLDVGEKRFMRFGKKDGLDNKRFMRFGKRENGEENLLNEEDIKSLFANKMPEKKFMRFGKRKITEEDGGSLDYESAGKRFMRFGKRQDSEAEKRFMKFGKRANEEEKRFMRFGRNHLDTNELDDVTNLKADPEKRFMRFGKRDSVGSGDVTRSDAAAHKRFMRFGKREDGSGNKRFMRFGKRQET